MATKPAINHPINCGLATTSTFANQFAKKTIANRVADLEFSIEYAPISSGSTELVEFGDVNYMRSTYPSSVTNVRVSVNYLPEKFGTINSLISENIEILSNPTTDPLLFEYESNGTTSITATFGTNEKITKSTTTSILSSSITQDVFQNFLIGSLGKHIYDQINEYADESTSAPNHYLLYSTFDQTNNLYVKNSESWISSLDFSGLMVNKVGSGGITMVTAITPHHAIGVSHYPPSTKDVIYFCTSDGQTITRTVQSVGLLDNVDCCVVRFTEALPSTVKKYKTLPQNYKNYLPLNKNVYRPEGVIDSYRGCFLPLIAISHYRGDKEWVGQRSNRFAYIHQTSAIIDATVEGSASSISHLPANVEPNNFQNYDGEPSGILGGDSGGPCFFIINNDLVLINNHISSGTGALHSSFLSSIQSKINELGPSGQTYETVDLSTFTDFSS